LSDLLDFLDAYQFLAFSVIILVALSLSTYVTMASGSLSLAAPAFMAIGAYSSALASIHWQVPFPIALLIAAAGGGAAAAGVAVLSARLRALYLALMTLAVDEIVVTVALLVPFTGGASGLSGIPFETNAGWMFGFAIALVLFFWRFSRSRTFRFLSAIRQSELAARSLGLDIFTARIATCAIGGVIAGVAGALSAHLDGFVSPTGFGFDLIITILTAIVLGGMAAWYGAVLGGIVVALVPHYLVAISSVREYVYGGILVLVLIFLPRGLASVRLPLRRTWANARSVASR
jgi:branched-chain amino acid transport system permease protein